MDSKSRKPSNSEGVRLLAEGELLHVTVESTGIKNKERSLNA
ncbi:hypothetical protein [Paenibacillus sp. PAMC21692]|nr:hypothetical protein [Paenibacillus sp. PAMC21692]